VRDDERTGRAAAHRRNERDLIAVAQGLIRCSKLLIDRKQQATAVPCQARVAFGQQRPERPNGRSRRKGQRLITAPGYLTVRSKVTHNNGYRVGHTIQRSTFPRSHVPTFNVQRS
jgi:hypothetical protein